MSFWTASTWQQLRWRIIGSYLIIVLVGVSVLLLATQTFIITNARGTVQVHLATLAQGQDEAAIEQATTALLSSFRNAVLTSLILAALVALFAGVIASLWLTRVILRPLNEIASSSQRIADGRYDERITIPASTELARVATNFNEMADALAQVEQQRVALISNVSHELRTPLTGIEGYLEGVMDGVFPDNDETYVHMYQEVRRLRRLVNDLQSLSQVEAGQFDLQSESFDIISLGQRIINQLHPQIVALSLEIITHCPNEAIMVCADPDRTAQILLNLIGNALRYTPEGGQIILLCHIQDQFAQVVVQDTGIGIPADDLPYIFERFYRVDASRASASGGSGIGLTISRHLAWAMQGELTAASEGPGRGSEFILWLPLTQSLQTS